MKECEALDSGEARGGRALLERDSSEVGGRIAESDPRERDGVALAVGVLVKLPPALLRLALLTRLRVRDSLENMLTWAMGLGVGGRGTESVRPREDVGGWGQWALWLCFKSTLLLKPRCDVAAASRWPSVWVRGGRGPGAE